MRAERPFGALIGVSVLLLAGAVVAEALSAPFSGTGDFDSWGHVLEGAFEEGAELGAWLLLASAFAATALGPWSLPPASER